jgi:hypothetical protein
MSRNHKLSSLSVQLKAGPKDDESGTPGTLVPSLVTAACLALVPVAALAHEGRHDGMGFVQAARHLLTQPDHLAILAGLVALLSYGGWRVYRSRSLR